MLHSISHLLASKKQPKLLIQASASDPLPGVFDNIKILLS
ncbi:hypothetical protein SynSYN20_02538 [Synechococcus sp. SYN20]|nr:hypothetical protein SynSYN20_02538 [Synechococcus sp. SYN20]